MTPRSVRQRAAFWLAWWAASFGLWMLLVYETELAEMIAGLVAAAVAATAVEAVHARGDVSFTVRLRWFLALWRLPYEIGVDCWLLTRALWRRLAHGEPLEGFFRVIDFNTVGHDPRSEAKRAIAKWRGGVAPNAYVIGFDEEKNAVLVRQLVKTRLPPRVDPEEHE